MAQAFGEQYARPERRIAQWLFIKANKKAPSLEAPCFLGGERGIRTPDRLRTYTRFPGVRLKPLIHLSGGEPNYSKLQAVRYTLAQTALWMTDIVRQCRR